MIHAGFIVLVIAFGAILPSLSRWIARANLQRKNGCKPLPYLTEGVRLFGIDLYFLFFKKSSRGLEKLPPKQQFKLLGSTFATQIGRLPSIQTSDPSNIESAFGSNAASFGNGPVRTFAMGPLAGLGIMCADGSAHQHARALIRPTFSKAHIENEAAYDRHVQKLLGLLGGDGSTVDLRPLFGRLDLDTSTEFIFGESVASLDDAPDSVRTTHRFPNAFGIVTQGIRARIGMPLPLNILHRDKKFWDACQTIRQYVAESVEKALIRRQETGSRATQSYILVDNVLRESQNLAEVQDTLINVFLPGHDTISIAISNNVFHLARHPEVWRKLRQLVLDLPEITNESLKRLDYLQNIIKETFRVTPPLSGMSRTSLNDTILPTGGGPDRTAPVFVPKGTAVTANFYVLHRRAEVYGSGDNGDDDKDIEQWRPERWEKLKVSQLGWKFMPFGGGPHICPAQVLAQNRIAFTLARMAQAFERIENRDPVEEFVPFQRLVTESKNGVKVALYRG